MITITNIGRSAIIAAAATAAIIATVPAGAKPARPPEPTSVKEVRYCTIDEIGGSRFTKRTCKTRDAWMKDENFDPVAFMAKTRK
jgi:hypothetical protein